MKNTTAVWEQFIAFDTHGNVLAGSTCTSAAKVVCRHCEWERHPPNATRMRQHYERHHATAKAGAGENPDLSHEEDSGMQAVPAAVAKSAPRQMT